MKKWVLMIVSLLILSCFRIGYGQDNGSNEVYGVAVDSAGNVIVVGQHEISKDKYVMRVQKYGSDGTIKWQTDYEEDVLNVGKAVVASGDYIYVGGAIGKEVAGIPLPSTDYLIVKYTKNGATMKNWTKKYNKGFTDILNDMAIGDDGYLYATGMTFYIDISDKNLTNIDFWTIKVDPTTLEIVKEDIFDSNIDAAFGIDAKGDTIVVVGSVGKDDINSFCVVKYDQNLNVKGYYEKRYKDLYSCAASDAVILPDGRIAVTGWVYINESTSQDILTILFNQNLEPIWSKTAGGNKKDDALSIATDSQGNIIVAGYKYVSSLQKWYIIKYDSNGNVIWEKLVKDENGNTVTGQINRIAVDSNDNIIAAGYREIGGEHTFCIIKLSPDGDFIWQAAAENPPEPTRADFIWLPENPTRADIVHFYDKSTGDIISWHWDFGDGNTSNEQNPVHQYTKVGTYQVTLRVVGSDINDTVTKEITIVNALPIADFNYTPLNPTEKQSIAFVADATDKDGYITNYTWFFGDGDKAYGKQVTHTYDKSGNYTVKLRVYDNDGEYKEVWKLVIVNPVGENLPPVAYFECKAQAGKGEEVVIDASKSYDEDGNILIYMWDWDGDGKIDDEYTIPQAVHRWYEDGEYNIVLIVEDDKGYKNSYTRTIRIGGIPELIIELPEQIEVKKGQEKTIYVKVICLNQTLYYANFEIEGNITVVFPTSGFNLSAGSPKNIPITIKADKDDKLKMKIVAKDLERGITIESNVDSLYIIVKSGGGTPSFTLPLLLIAIAIIVWIRRNARFS